MPVLIALAAVLLLLDTAAGLPLPAPLSAEWWLGRPLWLGVVGLAAAPVVAALWRFERSGRGAATPSAGAAWFAAVDTVLGAGGVTIVLVAGFGAVPASVALVFLAGALFGTGRVAASLRSAAIALWCCAGSLSRMMREEPSADARIHALS